MRLGDPSGNFISESAIYSSGSPIDEEATILNDAARKVSSDLYRNGTALLTGQKSITPEPGVTEYALPKDLIGVQEVFWEDSSTRYEVEQRPLQSFQDIDRTVDRPIYFDVFGQSADIVARTWSQEDTKFGGAGKDADHTVRLGWYYNNGGEVLTTAFSGIRVGDVLHNMTDGSEGTIAAIIEENASPADNYYLTAELRGGTKNVCTYGDVLQIERAEKVNPILHIYPQVSESKTVEVVSTGIVDDWLNNKPVLTVKNSNLNSSRTVQGAGAGTYSPETVADVKPFYLYAIRISGGSPDGRQSVMAIRRMVDGASTDWVSPSTGDYESDGYIAFQYYSRDNSDSILIKPNNPVWLNDPDNTYYDQPTPYAMAFTNGDPGLAGATYELLKLKGIEPLKVYYARYPVRLTQESDELELPEIALEAILNYSEAQANMKAEGGSNNISAQALAMYEMELEKISRFLRTRHVRGNRTVRNVMSRRSYRYG